MIMTPVTLPGLLMLLISRLSTFHQVHCDDGRPSQNISDLYVSSELSTAVASTTQWSKADEEEDDEDDNSQSNSDNDQIVAFNQKGGPPSICAYYDDTPSKSNINKENNEDGGTGYSSFIFPTTSGFKKCKSYCFTLWVSDPRNKSKITISKQDCWLNSEADDCLSGKCVSDDPPKQNTHFCCCSGAYCNTMFEDAYDPAGHTTTTTRSPLATVGPLPDYSYRDKTIVIALVSILAVSVATVLTYLAYRLCHASKPTSPQSSSVVRMEADQEHMLPTFNVDHLKIEDVIVRGRYSEVRKGLLGDKEVAVKIYQQNHRQYYYNEGNAFTLPFMDHENLVKFYGAKEQDDPETNLMQYIIVTEYIHLGSLTSYLKHNTLDWYTLCHMCQGVSRGLAHLHTDIQKGVHFKPAIAHRDLNTRNILVNPDLTCVIADLGFSVAMIGSKIIKNGVAENAEQASLADVGTLRYMAPEVFDGAVNLRDCEASLKQIDIYALGLVIWEIASRCVDLYQGAPVPEYQLPFQAEAGAHPTFEVMQVLVVKYKTRPKFPEVWKDTNPAVISLKETIEDCWDTDAEARLTSLCIQERMTDMTALWVQGTKHRGVTPTLNATMNLPESNSHGVISSGSTVVSNGVTYLPSYVDRNNDANEEESGTWHQEMEQTSSVVANGTRQGTDDQASWIYVATEGVAAPLISNVGHLASSGSINITDGRVRSWLQDQSMSGSTMDTILPPTPSVDEENAISDPVSTASHPPIKANNVMLAKNKAVILHPNQGRNPTVERNTHKRSDEELIISGNQLVGPGDQPMSGESHNNRRGSLGTQSAPPNRNGDGGSYDDADAIESFSLVQNDALNHHHMPRNPPIPYLQNHVHGEGFGGSTLAPHLTRPKLANISSNRNSYLRLQGEDGSPQPHSATIQNVDEVETKSLKHKLSKLIRPKDLGVKFSQIVFGSKKKKNLTNSGDVEAMTGQNLDSNRNLAQYINSGLEASPVNRNSSSGGPVDLEVQMINGSAVTRPCSDTNSVNPLAQQGRVTGPQERLSTTNVMRLAILNASHGELPSSSLFPKSVGPLSLNDTNVVSSKQEQENNMPLQTLVTVRSAKDYGSMRLMMVNQAYGLDSNDDTCADNLHQSAETTSSNLNAPSSATVVMSSNAETEQTSSLVLSHNFKSISSLSQSSSSSGNTSNFTFSRPSHSSLHEMDGVTAIQNKTITPLNKDVSSSSSLNGAQPNVLVRKYPQEGSQVAACALNTSNYLDLQYYHTDTKGGDSIMHNIHIDEARLSKDGLVSRHSSRHSSRPTKKSASQLPVIRSQPLITCPAGAGAGDSHLVTEGAAACLNMPLKSRKGLSQSQSVTDLGWHQHLNNGDDNSQGDYRRENCWQENDSIKSAFSSKHRPQSLSLKGHNYSRNRGRSASSSSSVPGSVHLKTGQLPAAAVAKPASSETVKHDENGPLTLVVPNVTLDRSSPLFQVSCTTGKKNAVTSITVPSVAVSSVRTSSGTNPVVATSNTEDNSSSTITDSGITAYIGGNNHCEDNITASDKQTCLTPTSSTTTSNKFQLSGEHRLDSSEKIRRRIKTPVSFKKGRLSLYDDRLMTQSLGFVSLSAENGIASNHGDSNNNSSGGNGGLDMKQGDVCTNGHNNYDLNMSSLDYHKMIKSDSDLVV